MEKYHYPALTVTLTGDYRVIYQRFVERDASPDRHRGHVVNDCYPGGRSAASLSYENYIHGMERRGYDTFSAGGEQIRVDTTDFYKVDMEGLLSRITAWKEGCCTAGAHVPPEKDRSDCQC